LHFAGALAAWRWIGVTVAEWTAGRGKLLITSRVSRPAASRPVSSLSRNRGRQEEPTIRFEHTAPICLSVALRAIGAAFLAWVTNDQDAARGSRRYHLLRRTSVDVLGARVTRAG
jgi:hypothetical protein